MCIFNEGFDKITGIPQRRSGQLEYSRYARERIRSTSKKTFPLLVRGSFENFVTIATGWPFADSTRPRPSEYVHVFGRPERFLSRSIRRVSPVMCADTTTCVCNVRKRRVLYGRTGWAAPWRATGVRRWPNGRRGAHVKRTVKRSFSFVYNTHVLCCYYARTRTVFAQTIRFSYERHTRVNRTDAHRGTVKTTYVLYVVRSFLFCTFKIPSIDRRTYFRENATSKSKSLKTTVDAGANRLKVACESYADVHGAQFIAHVLPP